MRHVGFLLMMQNTQHDRKIATPIAKLEVCRRGSEIAIPTKNPQSAPLKRTVDLEGERGRGRKKSIRGREREQGSGEERARTPRARESEKESERVREMRRTETEDERPTRAENGEKERNEEERGGGGSARVGSKPCYMPSI